MRSEMAELRSEDGVGLATTMWHADDADPQAAVVVAHGLTITKDHPSVVALAEELAAQGFAVVAYDGRGHGGSDGLCTLGSDEALDVGAAVEHARTISPRVVTVGSSMGAIAVLRYGTTDPDLAGVVAVSAPARWRIHSTRALVAAAMTRTGVGRRIVRRRTGVRLAAKWTAPPAPEDLAPRLACPAVIIHGSRDRFIPVREAERLYRRLGEPRRLDIVAGMGHGFGSHATGAIVEAVRWTLSAGASARGIDGVHT
jgi:alpha-beta hydrolase superfamily lysophospholipase